jgi:hypothetical protein
MSCKGTVGKTAAISNSKAHPQTYAPAQSKWPAAAHGSGSSMVQRSLQMSIDEVHSLKSTAHLFSLAHG